MTKKNLKVTSNSAFSSRGIIDHDMKTGIRNAQRLFKHMSSLILKNLLRKPAMNKRNKSED